MAAPELRGRRLARAAPMQPSLSLFVAHHTRAAPAIVLQRNVGVASAQIIMLANGLPAAMRGARGLRAVIVCSVFWHP